MNRFWVRTVVVCLLTHLVWGSPRPDIGAIYSRLVCVVPMIGAGTAADPIRPLFTSFGPLASSIDAPVKGSRKRVDNTKIIAFQSVPTDDGRAAIVMFVARNYLAFQPILKDSRVIEKFERKDVNEAELVQRLRRYKSNFDLRMLRIGTL